MPKYTVRTWVTATVEEIWTVEAESEEAAKEAVFDGEAELEEQSVIGDEVEREVHGVELAPVSEVPDMSPLLRAAARAVRGK